MQRIRSGKYPNFTSTWEIGGSCWVSLDKNDPGYNESLIPFLKEGSIEIVGGTWCEPFCLLINGESVMRQFLYGMEAIEKHLDTKVTVYTNQEHGTFAQMPQILSSFGLKAVVNRTQWAPFGIESGIDADVAEWIGVDGSKILLIPRYTSMDYSTLGPNNALELQCGSVTGHNREWRTEEKFKEMRDSAMKDGIEKPFMTMLEDIWSEEWRSSDEEMEFYSSLPYVKFISVAQYLALFGIEV
jgi:alpha-mannosidase